jgi:hypothetical protein
MRMTMLLGLLQRNRLRLLVFQRVLLQEELRYRMNGEYKVQYNHRDVINNDYQFFL